MKKYHKIIFSACMAIAMLVCFAVPTFASSFSSITIYPSNFSGCTYINEYGSVGGVGGVDGNPMGITSVLHYPGTVEFHFWQSFLVHPGDNIDINIITWGHTSLKLSNPRIAFNYHTNDGGTAVFDLSIPPDALYVSQFYENWWASWEIVTQFSTVIPSDIPLAEVSIYDVALVFDVVPYAKWNGIEIRDTDGIMHFVTGDFSSPQYPQYPSPDGGAFEDSERLEGELKEGTASGMDEMTSLFTGIGDIFTVLGAGILAVSTLINTCLVEVPILNSVLMLSLSLGITAFLLVGGVTIINTVQRTKGKEKGKKKGE